jgi:hypothetical protein
MGIYGVLVLIMQSAAFIIIIPFNMGMVGWSKILKTLGLKEVRLEWCLVRVLIWYTAIYIPSSYYLSSPTNMLVVPFI